MATLSQQQTEAAQEFVNTTIDVLKTENGVHAETAIAGTSRMAGTFLFRSFGIKRDGVIPGQAVLSEMANEQGPQFIQILCGVLTHVGIDLNNEQLGKTAGPENQPQFTFLETQRQLEPRYLKIKDRLGLSLREAAESAAVASALLVQQCSKVLDPNIAFRIAVNGFVEGSKTAPAPVIQ